MDAASGPAPSVLPSLGKACAATTSTPSGSSTSGNTYDAAARGRQSRDHRALDHPARRRALARGDDARTALQRRAERSREPHGDVRRQVDVDEARYAFLAEDAGRAARLPDEALEQVRAG